LDSWLQDVRYALRLLQKSASFTMTAALSLAIGIGANATIFSVTNALLLRPLPGLAEADRLVDIGRTQDGSGFDTTSYPNYRDIRARATTLEGVYAYRIEPNAMSLGGRGDSERVYGTVVSGNYFTVLGTVPSLGRLLRDDDDGKLGERAVAVISHDLWSRRYNADPAIVGQPIMLNGTPFTIVGVAPRGFQGTTLLKPDVWVPLSMLLEAAPRMSSDLFTSRGAVWLVMGGRLKNGVTTQQAQSELSAIGAALEREYPRENRGKGLTVATSAIVPGRINMVGGFLLVLMVIVGLILLIACVNIAGMLLARAAARRREIAVRLAMGAGRARLIRQLLTETVVLFGAGGMFGMILSRWLTALLLAQLPQLPVPLAADISIDWRVVTFAAALAFVAAIVSGLAPALHASRADLVPALKTEGLTGGPSRLRLRNIFVVGQVTMSLILVVAAGLFLRALQHAADIEAGFDEQHVDVVTLDLSLAGYKAVPGDAFVRELLGRTRGFPGVESATAAIDLPLDGGRMGLGEVRIPGAQLPNGQASLPADWNVVEPGFFSTLKLRLVQGRDFNDADGAKSPPVAIVNQAFAKQAWPNRDPIGQRLERDTISGPVMMTVVGIAADAKLITLSDAVDPYIYVPYTQQYMPEVSLLVRSNRAVGMIPQIRRLIREMNPNLPVSEAMPLSEVTAIGLIPQRIAAAVAGSLGVVGLLLAAIGIYGVTAYAVTRRTREIGIRMALGADSANVLRLVLRQGLFLATIGVAIGVVVAAAASRLIENLLVGVKGLDPLTFVGACGVFAIVTLIASYIPARRAADVDPMAALRSE
jgi:putative ABC transport system permease protein